jgi:hypothetical protein
MVAAISSEAAIFFTWKISFMENGPFVKEVFGGYGYTKDYRLNATFTMLIIGRVRARLRGLSLASSSNCRI